jgi:CoA:oxalate CoA-transferase
VDAHSGKVFISGDWILMVGPLEGVFVLDLTRALAGPYGTLLLADLGANVVKVEGPEADLTLASGYQTEGIGSYWLSINRNKQTIKIDLRAEDGKRVFWELVDQAEIVVENFRPGVMDRLGIGWTQLRQHKPSIVLASLSGFGQDGPWRERPAFDAVVQALAGGMSMTGEPGQPPVRAGVPIGDVCAGMTTAMAALAALVHARATGQGTHVDVAMLDVQISLASYQMGYYLLNGAIAGPQGTGQMNVPTYRAFRCADDKYLMMCANREEMWKGLCRALGMPELMDDPRFEKNNDRLAHKQELYDILEPAFAAHDSTELRIALEQNDVPIAPINSVKEALENEHVEARGLVQEAVAPSGNTYRFVGPPFRFSDMDPVPAVWPEPYVRPAAELRA